MTLDSKLRKALASYKPVEWERQPEILLHPQVPKPMHGLAPRVVLGKKWWDAERRAAYASTDYHCQACGTPKHLAEWHRWLEGHEIYDIDYRKGLCRYLRTVPLCHACHCYIHAGRLTMLMEADEITAEKYAAIINHGDRILKAAGLKRLAPYVGPMAEWSKWRLAIGRRHYKPLHKSYRAWCKYFDNEPPELGEDGDVIS